LKLLLLLLLLLQLLLEGVAAVDAQWLVQHQQTQVPVWPIIPCAQKSAVEIDPHTICCTQPRMVSAGLCCCEGNVVLDLSALCNHAVRGREHQIGAHQSA
jgi:hypothetical protein